MRIPASIALLVVSAGLAACEDGGAPEGDRIPVDPRPAVTYYVAIGAVQPGIDVSLDGARLAPVGGAYRLSVGYDDVDSGLSAPLFHLETSRDGIGIDAIDIGFGACVALCAEAGCGDDISVEVVQATFDAEGMFEGGADDPRSWRGVGCLRCTSRDGTGTVVCT